MSFLPPGVWGLDRPRVSQKLSSCFQRLIERPCSTTGGHRHPNWNWKSAVLDDCWLRLHPKSGELIERVGRFLPGGHRRYSDRLNGSLHAEVSYWPCELMTTLIDSREVSQTRWSVNLAAGDPKTLLCWRSTLAKPSAGFPFWFLVRQSTLRRFVQALCTGE